MTVFELSRGVVNINRRELVNLNRRGLVNLMRVCILALSLCQNLSYAQNWLPLDKGIGFPYASINHLLTDSNCIYASGSFTEDGNGIPMRGIAKWDGVKWDSVGNANDFNATKLGICKYNNSLFTSGLFYDMFDPCFVKLNGAFWDTIIGGNNMGINCFAEKDGVLYFGGSFNKCGDDSTCSLGQYDGLTFSGLTPCYQTNNVNIMCMAFFQDTLYVGGLFYLFPQLPIAGLAKWDGVNLKQVAPEFSNSMCAVEAMVVYKNELYLGGQFRKVDGFSGDYIMKWDGQNFHEVGGGANQEILAMKVYNNDLYVGGRFTQVGGITSKNIAKWDGSQWTSLNMDDFDEFTCIRDICVYKDELYVAGYFRKIGNDSINSIAKYNHPLVSIKENPQLPHSVSVSPNPFHQKSTIAFLGTLTNARLQIFDILGNEINRLESVNGNQVVVSREGMRNGIYFFRVTEGNTVVGQGTYVVE